MLSESLLKVFSIDWEKPSVRLDAGFFSALVAQVFGRKDWVLVDRKRLRECYSMIYDLSEEWFIYYTPVYFASAVEELTLEKYERDPFWIKIYDADSPFSTICNNKVTCPFNNEQQDCLLTILGRLDSVKYFRDVPIATTGEQLFLNWIESRFEYDR